MATPQPNPLPGIRTLAKDMARKNQSKTATASTSPTKNTNPVPISAFANASDKNVYKAPNETRPIMHETRKENNTEDENENKNEKENKETIKPIKAKVTTTVIKSIPKSIQEPIVASKTTTTNEPTIIVDNEDAASATIIRDTKHNRFHLFPAIGKSLGLWFKEIKEKYFTKKAPKYTVPETSRRKGVIQEATSKTGKLTTFDRTSLQERIRQRQERAVPKVPTTTWSANTEPGFLLLEEPEEEPAVSNVKVVPRKSFRTTPPEPKPVETVPLPPPPPIVVVPQVVTPVIETPVVVPPVVSTPVVAPVVPAEPKPVAPDPLPITPVESASTIPVVRTLASEEIASRANDNRRTNVAITTATNQKQVVGITRLNPKNLREWLFSLNTNFISLGIIGLLIAVLVVGLSGYAWFSNHSQKITLTTTPNYPTLLSVPLQTLFISDLTKDNLFTQIIQNQKQSKYETLQIGLISSPSGESLLSSTEILNLIDENIGAVFAHSIKTIYFGSINKTTPFVVMKTTDVDTARGGLLAWEGSLKNSLLPLFSAFNPSLTATTTTEKLSFKDIVVNGNDARVLATEDGTPVLIYALTKQNILIITTDQKTLTELFTLIPKSS